MYINIKAFFQYSPPLAFSFQSFRTIKNRISPKIKFFFTENISLNNGFSLFFFRQIFQCTPKCFYSQQKANIKIGPQIDSMAKSLASKGCVQMKKSTRTVV